jgi:hypothetical protein
MIAVYVDDIIVTGDSAYVDSFYEKLCQRFEVQSCEGLPWYLGIEVVHGEDTVTLQLFVIYLRHSLWMTVILLTLLEMQDTNLSIGLLLVMKTQLSYKSWRKLCPIRRSLALFSIYLSVQGQILVTQLVYCADTSMRPLLRVMRPPRDL